jgi:hypothetical protein
VEYN